VDDLIVHASKVIRAVTGPSSADIDVDGGLLCRDGRIAAIDDFSDLRTQHPSARTIGGPEFVAIPGLVNGHHHIGLTPFQLGAPDLPLEEWALAKMGLRYVDPYLDHLYAALMLIESGTTTVQVLNYTPRGYPAVDMDTAGAVLRAYEDAGLRVAYAFNAVDQNSIVVGGGGGEREFLASIPASLAARYREAIGLQYRTPNAILDFARAIVGSVGANDRVHVTLGPSTVDRCSDELLRGIRELATEMRTTIHIHLQETIHQRRYAEDKWGTTPLQHLKDLGFLGPDVTCGHAVWLTEDDIATLEETGTRVCHNASSNLRLSSGIAPVPSLVARGIPISIGTDEAGLNDDKDLFQEMRLVATLHRATFSDHRAPTGHEVFRMATEAGAESASFGAETGTLEVGRYADIVLIRNDRVGQPFVNSEVSVVDALVRRARSSDVDTVVVGGRILMEGGQVTTIDRPAILRQLADVLESPRTDREVHLRDLAADLKPHFVKFLADGLGDFRATPFSRYNSRE
jgi:cytosine/adenosine deaminase-related metal-dependent hydrolase